MDRAWYELLPEKSPFLITDLQHSLTGTRDRTMSSYDSYVALMKRVLTDTIYQAEPNAQDDSGATFVRDFVNHYIRGRALTLLPLTRLDNVQACIEDIVRNSVPGDIIETGVWRGGCTIFMRAILKALDDRNRCVWVADSFAGLPSPDPERYPIEAKAHAREIMSKEYRHFAVDLATVQQNFERFGLLDDQVRFLVGWFKDTLPTAAIKQLSLMRLDGDYYESTMDALTHLYPKLSVGGYVIIDDYGEDVWTYCRKAVDEYRSAHGIDTPMQQVDSKCFYWRRSF